MANIDLHRREVIDNMLTAAFDHVLPYSLNNLLGEGCFKEGAISTLA